MANPYTSLAAGYDSLTGDVDYEGMYTYLTDLFHIHGKQPKSILDAACGTGSLSWIFSENGYQTFSFDQSEEMLTEAAGKNPEAVSRPFFFCADLQNFLVPQRVDAAVCMLDSMNYLLTEKNFTAALSCLEKALNPGGLLIFDIRPPEALKSFDGQIFVDETEDIFCLWRTYFDEKTEICSYDMDLFFRNSQDLWQREQEEHLERAWPPEWIVKSLQEAGFQSAKIYGDRRPGPPLPEDTRIFFVAEKE